MNVKKGKYVILLSFLVCYQPFSKAVYCLNGTMWILSSIPFIFSCALAGCMHSHAIAQAEQFSRLTQDPSLRLLEEQDPLKSIYSKKLKIKILTAKSCGVLSCVGIVGCMGVGLAYFILSCS